jgi:competence protein CoiA
VKTDDGWVIEFQHSLIKPEERRSREAFYPKLVWVVDGLRREKDRARFLKTWDEGSRVRGNSPVRRVWSAEGALLRDWAGSLAHVFFDLGDEQVLWWLSPKSGDWWAYVARVSRAEFIETHRRTAEKGASEFGSLVEELSKLVPDEESNWRTRASEEIPPRNFERDFLLLGRRTLQGLQRRNRPGRHRR